MQFLEEFSPRLLSWKKACIVATYVTQFKLLRQGCREGNKVEEDINNFCRVGGGVIVFNSMTFFDEKSNFAGKK
jgi:hypothetical protein